MLLFSDLHLSDATADVVFDEVLPGIERAYVSGGHRAIYFLGDFWHDKHAVSTYCLSRLSGVLRRWADMNIQLYMIPGNHDLTRVAGHSGIDILSGYKCVHVQKTPGEAGGAYWIPFMDQMATRDALQVALDKSINIPIFMHTGFKGAYLSPYKQDETGLQVSAPDRLIVSGHYHGHQRVREDIYYVGSPYQVSRAEAEQPKGYCVIKDDQLLFQPMDWGPNYRTVRVGGPDMLKSEYFQSRDVIDFVFAGADPADYAAQLEALDVSDYRVTTETVEHKKARLEVDDGADLAAYAEAYARQKQPEVVDRLMALFAEVIHAA